MVWRNNKKKGVLVLDPKQGKINIEVEKQKEANLREEVEAGIEEVEAETEEGIVVPEVAVEAILGIGEIDINDPETRITDILPSLYTTKTPLGNLEDRAVNSDTKITSSRTKIREEGDIPEEEGGIIPEEGEEEEEEEVLILLTEGVLTLVTEEVLTLQTTILSYLFSIR
jgi:hypothetical protein